MKKQRRKSTICPNCQTALVHKENYCPECGQENNDKEVSLRILINDFFQDYFVFDSKLFNSLRPLLFQPGIMTREFLNGKRNYYIPPIRLFLFLSFVYFGLAYSFSSDWTDTIMVDGSETTEEQTAQFYESMKKNTNLLILLFTPIQAALVMLFFRSSKRKYYASFFVWTLHLFSLWLIIGIFRLILSLFFEKNEPGLIDTFQLIVYLCLLTYLMIYAGISLKRVFEKSYTWLRFIALLILSLAVFLGCVLLWVFFLAWSYDLVGN